MSNVSTSKSPEEKNLRHCQVCMDAIIPDGYGDWVHADGYYMCVRKEGEVATP